MTQFLNVQPGCEAPDFSAADFRLAAPPNCMITEMSSTRPPGTRQTTSATAPTPRFRAEAWWLLWTGLICAHFSLVYNLSNRPFLDLAQYAAGRERSPFQERVLMAWVFRAFTGSSLAARLADKLPVQLHDPYLAIELLVSFAALFGAVAFTRGSVRVLTADRNFSRWAALLVIFMAYFNLPLIYGLSYTLPYDLPSLFFFSGCIFCILRRSYPGFYLLFVLGTFNRETICFVTFFFVIWELNQLQLDPVPTSRRSTVVKPWLLLHVALQAALWVGIKVYLKHAFALNPQESGGGGLFVPHLQYNLREIFKPQQWPLLASTFGFTLPLLISQRAWIREKGIARACAVLLPLWLCLMFYVGVIIEIRIYTELIALVSLAIALIVFNRCFNRSLNC